MRCLLISVSGVATDAREAIQTEMAILGNTDEAEEPLVTFQKTKLNYRRTNLFSVLYIRYCLTRFFHMLICYSNSRYSYHSRVATISFSTSGGAASIQERD